MDYPAFIVFVIGTWGLLANTSLQYELQPQLCKKIDNSCKNHDDCCLGTCCFNNECQQSWECSPCKNITCPESQSCYLDEKSRPASGKWKPVCAPDNPCSRTDCGEGRFCQMEQTANNPPIAKCVTVQDACIDVTCSGDDLSCYTELNCMQGACVAKPVCSYMNPCFFLTCSFNQTCTVYQPEGSPPTAQCLSAGLTCQSVTCPRDEKCYTSLEDSCDGFPKPVCAHPDPCRRMKCLAGLTCKMYQSETTSPTATCVLE